MSEYSQAMARSPSNRVDGLSRGAMIGGGGPGVATSVLGDPTPVGELL